MNLKCIFSGHDEEKIYTGSVQYEEKRNKDPLHYRGFWDVIHCRRKGCNYERSEQIETEKEKGPIRI